MDLLKNKLIRKYFSPMARHIDVKDWEWEDQIAHRVLRAMQEPIHKGDLYLSALVRYDQGCQVQSYDGDDSWTGFHAYALRLPDMEQKRPMEDSSCRCFCHGTNPPCCSVCTSAHQNPQPSVEREEEEKIRKYLKSVCRNGHVDEIDTNLEKFLCELVELAKKSPQTPSGRPLGREE